MLEFRDIVMTHVWRTLIDNRNQLRSNDLLAWASLSTLMTQLKETHLKAEITECLA